MSLYKVDIFLKYGWIKCKITKQVLKIYFSFLLNILISSLHFLLKFLGACLEKKMKIIDPISKLSCLLCLIWKSIIIVIVIIVISDLSDTLVFSYDRIKIICPPLQVYLYSLKTWNILITYMILQRAKSS